MVTTNTPDLASIEQANQERLRATYNVHGNPNKPVTTWIGNEIGVCLPPLKRGPIFDETTVRVDLGYAEIPVVVEYRWVTKDNPDGTPGRGQYPEAVRCYIEGAHENPVCKELCEQIPMDCREIENAMDRIARGGKEVTR